MRLATSDCYMALVCYCSLSIFVAGQVYGDSCDVTCDDIVQYYKADTEKCFWYYDYDCSPCAFITGHRCLVDYPNLTCTILDNTTQRISVGFDCEPVCGFLFINGEAEYGDNYSPPDNAGNIRRCSAP